jgi:hypothetical protein
VFPKQYLPNRRLLLGACAALLVAQVAPAQTTQHRESDLEFVNRLKARAEHMDARVANLYAVTGIQPTGRKRRSGSGLDVDTQDSGMRTTQPGVGSIDGADLGRLSRKVQSITRKLESEHEKLSSGEPLDEKQRAKSEKNLDRIDRDLERIDAELSSMERIAY